MYLLIVVPQSDYRLGKHSAGPVPPLVHTIHLVHRTSVFIQVPATLATDGDTVVKILSDLHNEFGP